MMRLLQNLVFHMSLLRDLLRVLRLVFKRTPDRVYVLHILPVTTLNSSSPSRSLPISHIFAQQDPWCRPLHRQAVHHKLPQLLQLQVPLRFQDLLPIPAQLRLQVQAQPARKAGVLTIILLVRLLGDQFLINRSIISLLGYQRVVGGWTTPMVGCLMRHQWSGIIKT